MPSKYDKLLRAAKTAKSRAHAPYSKFRVGAAILTTKGGIFTGCNVESSSYSMTICAERTAIFKAMSEGERHFKAVAVVADDPDFTPPCGACRQVLSDLAGNIDVVMLNSRGKILIKKLKELLPFAFDKQHLDTATRTKK